MADAFAIHIARGPENENNRLDTGEAIHGLVPAIRRTGLYCRTGTLMPRPRSNPLFEISGQWVARIGNSKNLYHHWLDARTGQVRRASLGTEHLEEAKIKLARIVLMAEPKAMNASIAIVLEKYFVERTDKRASGKVARSAGRTMLEFFGAATEISDMTDKRQAEFVEDQVAKGRKLSYVARTLSVLAAAFTHAKIREPVIIASEAKLIELRGAMGSPVKKAYIPTDDEIIRLFAADLPEKFRRWCVLSLLTGCRPEAALDIAPESRRADAMVIDLNPRERPQNKKHRPIVRETRTLAVFMQHWRKAGLEEYGDRYCGYGTMAGVKSALKRARTEAHIAIPELSTYSMRHKVTTVLRRARVPEDEIAIQLGHKRPHLRVTGGYGEYSPDYLKRASRALDRWFLRMWRSAEVLRNSQGIRKLTAEPNRKAA